MLHQGIPGFIRFLRTFHVRIDEQFVVGVDQERVGIPTLGIQDEAMDPEHRVALRPPGRNQAFQDQMIVDIGCAVLERFQRRYQMMGGYLAERYGDDYLPVGFLAAHGSYYAMGEEPVHKLMAPPPGSVASFFEAAGQPRLILDTRTAVQGSEASDWVRQSLPMRSIGAVATESQFYPDLLRSHGGVLAAAIRASQPAGLESLVPHRFSLRSGGEDRLTGRTSLIYCLANRRKNLIRPPLRDPVGEGVQFMAQGKKSGSAPRLPAQWRQALSRPQIPVLVALLILGFWVRVQQRDFFAENQRYWAVTAFHLASARAISEGHPLFYIPEDRKVAHAFLFDQEGSLRIPLSELDRRIDAARPTYESLEYEPYFADQSGWGFMIYLARKLPGVKTLADVCTIQILIDLGALLLLFPIGVFITGRRWLALIPCALYAIYLPLAFASAEPFRDAWPGIAILYSMALLLPAWKRGPGLTLKGAGWLLAAGAAVGLATYVRSTAVTIPVTLFVVTWILWRRFWASVGAGAIVLAGTFLILSPWMIMTYRQAHVVSPTSSGGGHTFLIGMGEEPDNPMGLRFDDTSALVYVRDVCGYDVKYLSFAYGAACLREAKRFIGDHPAWYAKIVSRRVLANYLYRTIVPRMKWGLGRYLSLGVRGIIERWLPPLGVLGILLGMAMFPNAWIPLIWVFHFWVFIFPFHSHPRLLLGGEWALMVGVVMLGPGLVHLVRRVLGRRGRSADAAAPAVSSEKREVPGPSRGFRMLATGAIGLDVVVLALIGVFRPVAPPETFDWRAGLASPDPAVQEATLARAETYGNDALPIWMAGLAHPSTFVQERTIQAALNYQFLLGHFDFKEGKSSIAPMNPAVTLVPVPEPDSENGYVLRATAPQGREVLFALAWPDTLTRGLYRISVKARGDGMVRLVFLNEKGVPVKEESFDARNEEFQLWDIPFENYAHQDPVIAAFEMVSMGGGGPRMQVEFESIEIWAEGGYQDYQPP